MIIYYFTIEDILKSLFLLLLLTTSCASFNQDKNIKAFPGEELPKDKKWVLELGYDQYIKGFYGAGYIFRTPYGELIPIATFSEDHNFNRIILRNKHFKSEDGKIRTGYVFKIFEWAEFSEESSGRFKVDERGTGALGSYGGQYIYNHKWTLAYQASLFHTNKIGTHVSLTINRDLLIGQAFYGLIRNHMSIGYKLGFITLSRRFSDDSTELSFVSGIEF